MPVAAEACLDGGHATVWGATTRWWTVASNSDGVDARLALDAATGLGLLGNAERVERSAATSAQVPRVIGAGGSPR